jgi:hypothetical protein
MLPPVWITPAGNLGVYPEGEFFQIPLEAVDPEDPVGGTLQFEVIAGQLPAGVQVRPTGLIVGIPRAVASAQGVPAEVSTDVTSQFATRVYTTRLVDGVLVVDRLADRTFTLTITGQDIPEFITPAGQIAALFDGTLVQPGIQIQYTDTDPSDTVIVRLVSGRLPTGLAISATGLISGYIVPVAPVNETAGFSRNGQGYDQFPFDFSTQGTNTNFEFTLEVTDGKNSNLRTFSIFVIGRNDLTADNTVITADSTFITTDPSSQRPPIITNPQGSIGTVRNDNFFAYQFNAIDFDGDQIDFEIFYIDPTTPIPGLTLDQNTGWLYGYLPDLGTTENLYQFVVRVSKDNYPDIFNEYNYSLTVIGAIDTDVTWLTPQSLGTIDNGSLSDLFVAAQAVSGVPLRYQLVSGSDSKLPQGLSLLPSGLIAGRVSFNTFALDLGTTTFDVAVNDAGQSGPDTETTFDMSFTFTVQAISVDGLINVSRTFTIVVRRQFNEPFENLYIEAMPPLSDRAVISGLLQNQDIIPVSLLYRGDDPNFGRAHSVVYNHAYGLTASTLGDYVASLDINHYLKQLTLGEIRVAVARDRGGLGDIIYEVVYSAVIDNQVNSQGESVSKQITLPYPVDSQTVAYPNSLINMRDQVIDQVGQISNILPTWMLSKQLDGTVPGFVPAWVIAYAQPGQGQQIAYNIRTQFGEQLNRIDFEVDRYELDRLLSHNWDPETQAWEPPAAATTFDIDLHYQAPGAANTIIFSGGTGYAVGDRLRIPGSVLDGDAGVNDLHLTVNTVSNVGTIQGAFYRGTAALLTQDNVYTNVPSVNVTGSGTGATWDFVVSGNEVTEFDGGSMQFVAPVDMYGPTQIYDKYLAFPRRTILG